MTKPNKYSKAKTTIQIHLLTVFTAFDPIKVLHKPLFLTPLGLSVKVGLKVEFNSSFLTLETEANQKITTQGEQTHLYPAHPSNKVTKYLVCKIPSPSSRMFPSKPLHSVFISTLLSVTDSPSLFMLLKEQASSNEYDTK